MVSRRGAAAVILLIVVLAGTGVYVYDRGSGTSTTGCVLPLGSKSQLTSTLPHVNITAITEWNLPEPARYPNAVATAPDGSVWFGEQSLPGVAHLYPTNGTLVEYVWPSTAGYIQGSCPFRAFIWGIALWKGMVWATDQTGNSIVGLNPLNGSFTILDLPQNQSSPYSLVVGPDGALWFTALTNTAFIGRVSPSLAVSMYPVLQHADQIPSDIQFVNSSLAYFTALDPFKPNESGLYSFNPEFVANGISPTLLSGNVKLNDTTSVAVSPNTVWVVQHITSNIMGYNLATHLWTAYPTSTENYTDTTLPYFVRTSGNTVWFNEHYGNRIAELGPSPAATLTEFSESDPPATNYTQIQNDLTIAAAPGGLWFTSMTANYVGFVNANYRPGFNVSVIGPNSVELSGSSGVVGRLQIDGTWKKDLQVTVSDSEGPSSVPDLIEIRPNATRIAAGSGTVTLTVDLSLKGNLRPGPYTVAVTVSDGLVLRSAYLFITVP